MRVSRTLRPDEEAMLHRDTVSRAAKGITKTQADGLKRIRDRGALAWCNGGRAGGAISRMFDRMADAGLCTRAPHTITSFGIEVLDAKSGAYGEDGNRK